MIAPRRHWPALKDSLSPDSFDRLAAALEGPPGVAAFDADGTLWNGDVGEELLKVLEAEGHLPGPIRDRFAEYVRRFQIDPADGFAYAAQQMAGLSVSLVEELSERVFAQGFERAIFPPIREVVSHLVGRGWDVYIVSASNRWSVAPGARRLGLDERRILGVELAIQDGRFTDEVALPVPTLTGKPALLRARAGRAPDLAFGNSLLDLPLLESATLAVAVGPRHGDTQLLTEAARRGWPSVKTDAP